MIPHEHWWSVSQSYVSEILAVLAAAPDAPPPIGAVKQPPVVT